MVTAALLTRVYWGELPYLQSFIRHYAGIGFNAFYIIINDRGDLAAVQEHEAFSELKCKFIVNDLIEIGASKTFNLNVNFNLVLPYVTEDYLLNADVDEFLDISEYGSIQNFIESNPSSVYKFQWLISNNDGICDPTLAFEGVNGKQMCRTDCIKNINCHYFEVIKPWRNKPAFTGYMLIHYWGRSFRDIMIKTVSQKNLRNIKNGSLSQLKWCDSPRGLPGRFKIMATMSRVEKSIAVPNWVEVDRLLESQMIRSMFDEEEENQLFRHYQLYRSSLDYDNQVSMLANKAIGIHEYIRRYLCT